MLPGNCDEMKVHAKYIFLLVISGKPFLWAGISGSCAKIYAVKISHTNRLNRHTDTEPCYTEVKRGVDCETLNKVAQTVQMLGPDYLVKMHRLRPNYL